MHKTLFTLGLCLALGSAAGYCADRALVSGDAVPVPKELTSYRDVVKGVLPAVVSIEAKPKATLTGARPPAESLAPHGSLPRLPEELRKELEPFHKQPVPDPDITPGHAFGSGFVVDPSGVICTNDHVVRDADEVVVQLQDGRKFTSRDIKRDPKSDLAIIRIAVKEPLPALKLADSSAVEIGDRVLAVGAPFGLRGTVTAGIISAKARDAHLNMYEDFLQTDAAINPGNSGGPLVNLAGEVVGINSAIKSASGGSQGIGLAISSNMAHSVLDQLLTDGAVHRGYLGVQVQPLDAEVAAHLGLAGKAGVVIGKVMPGGPAARCGLQEGDVLTEIAGQPLEGPHILQRVIAGLPLGKPVELTVYRDGARKVLALTVEEQPEAFGTSADFSEPAATALGKIGVKVMELTPAKAKELGYAAKTEGVLIAEVQPNSVADGAGLRSGWVILKVDQQSVTTVAEAQKALDKGSLEKGVLLQVRTPHDGTNYVLLKSAPPAAEGK
jgi:serine protease Do